MTSPLMLLVARAVASSALAEDCVITIGGTDHATRATWLRREREDLETGELSLESSTRVPADDLPSIPYRGDRVRISGRSLYVGRSLERGPIYELTMTARQP